MKGKGTLTELERLKAEYGPKFKAEAPKYRHINELCFELFCPIAIGRLGLDGGGRLRVKKMRCRNKQCAKAGRVVK